jgi:hypothetical protein
MVKALVSGWRKAEMGPQGWHIRGGARLVGEHRGTGPSSAQARSADEPQAGKSCDPQPGMHPDGWVCMYVDL